MNLFVDYKKKISDILMNLESKKIIKLPNTLNALTVELPPKNQNADISCNAAMILSKYNLKPPREIANLLKENFLISVTEFDSIDIAKPGFLNISFKISFWKDYLFETINLGSKYGSNIRIKKNIILNLFLQILLALYMLGIVVELY